MLGELGVLEELWAPVCWSWGLKAERTTSLAFSNGVSQKRCFLDLLPQKIFHLSKELVQLCHLTQELSIKVSCACGSQRLTLLQEAVLEAGHLEQRAPHHQLQLFQEVLGLPLECPQFNGLWVLGEARKGSGEVAHRVRLSAVQVEFYRAISSLQIAQSQENPVAPPISQLQVVEHHQMDLSIILQVAEDGFVQPSHHSEFKVFAVVT